MRISTLFTTLIAGVSAIASPRDDAQDQKAVEVVPALYDGKCYYPVPTKHFKLKDYLGKWYQVAGTPFGRTAGVRCVSAQYTLNLNGTVAVSNSGIVGGKTIANTGTGTPGGKEYGGEGTLRVLFPGFPAPDCPGPTYVVQEYDAEHSIVQTGNWATLFVLARERNPPAAKVDAWIERAVCLGTAKANITKFDQAGC